MRHIFFTAAFTFERVLIDLNARINSMSLILSVDASLPIESHNYLADTIC